MIIAYDCETLLIRPAMKVPPVVCLTWQTPGESPLLVSRWQAHGLYRQWLEDRQTQLVGANTAFDALALSCDQPLLDLVFASYEQDRQHDVLTRQKLLDIAAGCYRGEVDSSGDWRAYSYSLQAVAERYGLQKDAEDPWRLKYSVLYETPTHAWPEEARNYALHDAEVTLAVYQAQEAARAQYKAAHGLDPLEDQYRQARAALWLTLTSVQGIRTDVKQVRAFAARVRADQKHLAEWLTERGLVRREVKKSQDGIAAYIAAKGLDKHFAGRVTPTLLKHSPDRLLQDLVVPAKTLGQYPTERLRQLSSEGLIRVKYVRDSKAAAARMLQVCDGDPKLTKAKRGQDGKMHGGGRIALDATTCQETGDNLLEGYAELSSLSKTLSTDIPFLEAGARVPIHTRFEELAKTGRTTSSSPNIQNLRKALGIRECFVPRPGKVLIDADYGQLELFTLAQVCLWWLGHSTLAEVLNAGKDPHLQVACQILHLDYETGKRLKKEGNAELSKARDYAKIANFGFPGGLGIEKLIGFAHKAGVQLAEEEARQLKLDWFAAFPEMVDYFAYIRGCESYPGAGTYDLVLPGANRASRGDNYCAACNKPFQGLGADVAKRAGWLIARECYTDSASSLWGSRIVNFIHDQFLVETDDNDNANAAAERIGELMAQAGRELLPDVPCKASPALSRRWSKETQELVEDGKLVPWEISEQKLNLEQSEILEKYVDETADPDQDTA